MTTKDKPVKKRRGMRKPIPTPREQQKGFLYLAMHLKAGKPLTKAQRAYLADRFMKIGNGESADDVFHLKRRPGHSTDDEERRQKISLLFTYVAQLNADKVEGYPELGGEGLSPDEALLKAVPMARELFGVEGTDSYSFEYLRKLWYDPSYAHMRTTVRTSLDRDSPFAFSPPEK
jgi:hypothetical protein